MKYLVLITAVLLSVMAPTRAETPEERMDGLEERIAALEAIVLPQPTTRPDPIPRPRIIKANDVETARTAIADGATVIQTTGLTVVDDFDARGATIELLAGGPNWKPAVQMNGSAKLLNATIKTPPSTYNASGQRTGFWKAIAANGKSMALTNVTFAPDAGFCIHLGEGELTLTDVKASTFSEYFMFQEAGTHAIAKNVIVRGGSKAESVWRVQGATYLIEDSELDNSGGGKSALRGDSPALPDGSPGGIVRRTKFVGQVGPNPLTEDDGGQMNGIDRWRYAEGWLYQLDAKRKPERIAFARQLYMQGLTAAEIVRATADKFIDPEQFAKVAKGRTKLSDGDIKLTLQLRAKDVGRRSGVLIEDCEIKGNLRINARMDLAVRRTSIDGGDENPISGNSQLTYPYPVDRVIVPGEQAPPPSVLFDQVTFKGGTSFGVDLKAWTSLPKGGLQFQASTYNGVALKAAAVSRIYNGSAIDVDGFVRIQTSGGLTYPDPITGAERSAWVGAYWGPGGTPAKPAPFTVRWREIEPANLRAFARSIRSPIFVLNIETWEVDPVVHGEVTARKWLERMADILQVIRDERPDVVVGIWNIVPVGEDWPLRNWSAWLRWKSTGVRSNELPDGWWAAKETEWRTTFETWQRKNDFAAAIIVPHVDALFPAIYPEYPPNEHTLSDDAGIIRLRLAEAQRVGGGKPVMPYYWPVVKQAGGGPVSPERSRNSIDAAFAAGADGVVAWFEGNRPRSMVTETLNIGARADATHREEPVE